MADRKSLLFSAGLVIAGEVLYQVALFFHAGGGPSAKDEFTAYANSAFEVNQRKSARNRGIDQEDA